MQGRCEALLKSCCSWPKSFGKLEVVKLSPICSLFAFSIFHYISLRAFHWENWGNPGAVPFKMIMRPRTVAQERGGASFKRPKQRSKGSLFWIFLGYVYINS